MSKLRRFALVAMAAGVLVAASGSAQVQPASSVRATAKLYRIAGTLTDSVSSAPLDGATMTILVANGGQVVQATGTDDQGRFAFEPVAAGKYSLLATRRGYGSENYEEHELFSSAIVAGEGQDTEHIHFRLDPGATLRCKVTDEAGEPVPGARLVLSYWSTWNGAGEHREPALIYVFDQQGESETFDMRSARLTVAVEASPWYAMHPLASELAGAETEEERAAMAALDVAYPLTYYDGVTDEGAAAPVMISAGATTELNFTLRAVPAAHVTVRMPNGGDEFVVPPSIQRVFLGEAIPGPDTGRRIEAQDVVRYEYAIAPGRYRIMGGIPIRTMDVDVNGDMEVDLSAAEPAVETVFQVQMADGSPLDKMMELHLLSEKPSEPDTTSRVDPRGEARFETLTPGKRIVDPTAPNTHLAVVAIKSGRKVTTGSRIDLTRKQTGVTLVVARGKSRIEGFAQMEGRGYAGAMIVLAPLDPAVNPTEFRRDQSDSDGSFMLPDVIPGEYTVVAIEDGWELDWRKPETIARYVGGGERVTVRAGDGELVRLSAPVKVQKR